MEIAIVGSMSTASKMIQIKNELEKMDHKVILPRHTKKFADGVLSKRTSSESVKNKIENDLIRDYFNKIKSSNAILVVNETKNEIKNYIGGNAFLEMGFAHVLDKKIFLLNPIPENLPYSDEIKAMQPVVLRGDFCKI